MGGAVGAAVRTRQMTSPPSIAVKVTHTDANFAIDRWRLSNTPASRLRPAVCSHIVCPAVC